MTFDKAMKEYIKEYIKGRKIKRKKWIKNRDPEPNHKKKIIFLLKKIQAPMIG